MNEFTNELVKYFDDLMSDAISKEAKEYLLKNGFFTAPCSSKYHLCYEGGLAVHSFNVAESLIYLTNQLGLKWEREISPYIVGMFHDLCKIDQYKYNPILKKYEWNSDQKIVGHGDKSITLIEDNIIKLTEEEKDCIRWHMGAFDTKENWTNYTNAIQKYRNVLFTHTADMMATHLIEVNKETHHDK